MVDVLPTAIGDGGIGHEARPVVLMGQDGLPVSNDTLNLASTADGQTVSISGTSAQSAALSADSAVIFSTVDCFAIYGASPTATTSCRFIPANLLLRVRGWAVGQKLAFITSGATGTVHISPGA